MVNHGLVVVPLFFIIALLAARAGGTDDLRRMGGLAIRAPVLAALFLIVALATLAMPGSANFIGEFLILTGVFKAKIVYAIVAATGVVLAAVYMIRLYQRSMHNPLGAGRRVARDDRRRRRRAGADRRRDPVPGALPAVRAGERSEQARRKRASTAPPRSSVDRDERA